MNALLALGPIVFILPLSACATGVAEFQLYGAAFDTQYVEGAKVFDRLAAAERTVAKRMLKPKAGIADFDPNQAANYLQVGDPPLTGAMRASLGAALHYNQALSGLATGEATVALTNRLSTAATSLSARAMRRRPAPAPESGRLPRRARAQRKRGARPAAPHGPCRTAAGESGNPPTRPAAG